MIATALDTGPLAAALNMTEICWLLERSPKVEAAFLARSRKAPSS